MILNLDINRCSCKVEGDVVVLVSNGQVDHVICTVCGEKVQYTRRFNGDDAMDPLINRRE